MSFPRRWKDRGKTITMAVPVTLKEPTMALALLLDKRDPELLDFLASRFIDPPTDP